MMRIGLVTQTEYVGGFLNVQVNGYGGADASVLAGDAHFPLGSLSRPLDPDLDPSGAPVPDRGCQVLYWWGSAGMYAIPTIDPRLAKQLPELGKGESFAGVGGTADVARYIHVGPNGVTLGALEDESGEPAIPVALATPLTTYLTAMEVLLAQMGGIIDTKLIPIGPSAAALATSFATAQAATKEAIASLLAKAV